MENNYKYKFSKIFYIIAIVGSILAVGCIIVNVVRVINLLSNGYALGFYEYVSLILAIVLSVAFILFIITALIKSYYQITDKAVVLKWGIIKNTVDISDVKEIKFITNKNKLELTFEDESYFIIVVDDRWKEAFIDELKTKFPNIPYIQETEEDKK